MQCPPMRTAASHRLTPEMSDIGYQVETAAAGQQAAGRGKRKDVCAEAGIEPTTRSYVRTRDIRSGSTGRSCRQSPEFST
jgi:hypothetical protein